MKKIRLGAGAGYSGDRIEPAVEVAEKGNIQYLVFECLAERTIAIAQQLKLNDPSKGYDPLLEARFDAVLDICVKNKIKIITNMGAANPESGALKIKEIAQKKGISGLKIASVSGDEIIEKLKKSDYNIEETGAKVSSIGDKLVSANAYLGCEPIVEALKNGADIVITGRVADPSIYLAPMVYEFGWSLEDYDKMGKGTVVGHLLECAGQITGGYFADPGFKDVPNLDRLGFPIAEVSEDGTAVITKVEGSGGYVNVHTCKEQMLYEIHDPNNYMTPDVVADFTNVKFEEEGKDRVKVTGATGKKKTDTYKVSIGYIDSYIGEGQMSYAGPGAYERGVLALDIVKKRLDLMKVDFSEIKYDIIGVNSILGDTITEKHPKPYEVRVRVTARTNGMANAIKIGNEVETLYTNGPACGGGAWKSARQVVAMLSALVPKTITSPVIKYEVI